MDEFDELEQLDHVAAALRATSPTVALALTDGDDISGPDLTFPTAWFTEAGTAIARVFGELTDAERHAVLDVVETFLHGGSELVRDCIAIGLLESVAEALERHQVDGRVLAPHLGTESRTYLGAWEAHERPDD